MVCVVLMSGAARHRAPDRSVAQALFRAALAADADSLDTALLALDSALIAHRPGAPFAQRVRASTRVARARYKRMEGVIEFLAPAFAASFNARRQELDDDDAPPPSATEPTGFPALEAIVANGAQRTNADSARRVVSSMRALATRLRAMTPDLVPTEAQVIELVRLEFARIETLGIAGFDAPRSGEAMIESAHAIDGLRRSLSLVGPAFWPAQTRESRELDSTFARASAYLRSNTGFETFNRLAFITGYGEPAMRALDGLRRAARVTPVRIQRAWRVDVSSPYARGAFDEGAYAPSGTPPTTRAVVELGEQLFNDASLSGNGTRTCASCHQPLLAFTDGLPRPSRMTPRSPSPRRNTPTLVNAALQPTQFMDERSVTLEDQVIAVLSSPAEMGSSLIGAAQTLRQRPSADSAFRRAFGNAGPAVTGARLQQALAMYVRSLIALDTRFDRAVRGDTTAMSAEERAGFTLFMGKAGCGTCHFAPLFNGTMPPRYMSSDVEVIGTPASPRHFSVLDTDSGRARIDHLPIHYRAFKVPTLRNIARTAPYMHNGAFRTLDEVVRFYEAGGGAGAGAMIANQTLSADSLHLTLSERRAIIRFLGALSP